MPSIVAVTHGLSRAAIVKKIKEEHGVMNNVAFRKALKALVAREILVPKETGSAPAYRNFDAEQNWNSHGNSKLLRFHNDRKKEGRTIAMSTYVIMFFVNKMTDALLDFYFLTDCSWVLRSSVGCKRLLSPSALPACGVVH